MPPRPKTPAEKAKLRAKIIDTARDVFIHKGVEAVTMRDIAKRVGYSATAIYLYFADKQALIQAVCDTDLLKLASEFKKVLVIQDPVERLFALGRAYAMFALNYPNHYRMIFMTPHAPLDPAASNIEQNNVEQDAYFQLKSVVSEVHAAGKFKPEINDPELAAQTIWAAMHGVCSLDIILGKEQTIQWCAIEARLQAMQTIIATGMLKEQNA